MWRPAASWPTARACPTCSGEPPLTCIESCRAPSLPTCQLSFQPSSIWRDGKHGRLVDENGTLVFRAHSPETARAELETAYADAESYPPSAEGTACTIRQPTDGAHEGAPGIVKNGICVPIAAQGETGDAEYDQQVRTARQQIHDARELAYVLKDIEDRHAWRLK
jgi:hypothetical protein